MTTSDLLEVQRKALLVIAMTPGIAKFLKAKDPKALLQVQEALLESEDPGFTVVGLYPDGARFADFVMTPDWAYAEFVCRRENEGLQVAGVFPGDLQAVG